jgi:hypothetical protein
MSFIFGGVRGHEDPELAAGNRRTRLHYARDVNDQRALADDGPNIRRSRNWTWLAVTAVVMAVLGFAGSRGPADVPLTAQCDDARIAVDSSQVTAGQPLRFRLTGADDTDYVVTLDGEPVRGDAGSTVTYTQTPAGPALRLEQCLSPTLVLATPAGDGSHELAMLRVAHDGTAELVTSTTLTVNGTR